MTHLKFFKDLNKRSVAIAGGKGASLGEMTQGGIPVPPGCVVLAEAFDRFIEETSLKEEIAARLSEVNHENTASIDHASETLRSAINNTPMPQDLTDEILTAFDELNAQYVAVRSSATAEDSSIASWAGELETYLNTNRDNVIERVKHCWSSLFTPRAIFYRYEKKLHDSYVSVAVVIQKMVQSEISGVAFTVHPVTEDPNQMILEAGYGLGEAIVSGQVTPDSYIISKSDMMIMDIHIGHQNKKLVRAHPDSGRDHAFERGSQNKVLDEENPKNMWIDLHQEEGEKQKLTGRQIIELATLCKQIEDHYGFPCDIEWAFAEGKFFVTQSRPITTLKK